MTGQTPFEHGAEEALVKKPLKRHLSNSIYKSRVDSTCLPGSR